MNKNERYSCDICGNHIEVQDVGSGGVLTCCQQPMRCITQNLTEVNLFKAFTGECVAHTKYQIFAKMAEKEGFRDIARHFNKAAGNERVHAKLLFKELKKIEGMETLDTETLLKSAVDGENYEDNVMYPDFAKAAHEEGKYEIEQLFIGLAGIEHRHSNMFVDLLYRVESDLEFHSERSVEWVCEECGHVHVGHEALDVCPVCHHPKSFQSRYQGSSKNIVML